MKQWNKLFLISMIIGSLSACTSTKDGADAGDATANGASDGHSTVGGDTSFKGHPLDNPDSLLSKRTVYFDFDKSQVRSDDRDIVLAHAEYLASHPNAKVILEGHADERGTREYNIALGERRAKAVSKLMVLQGVSPSQIEVISFGEERPVSSSHNESSWSVNRRVEILYPGL